MVEVVPESSMRKQSSGTFKPTEDTKAMQINPKDSSKIVQISCGLSSEQELMLVDFLLRNRDIFAWKPSDMLGILREVTEHSLDIMFGAKPVCNASAASTTRSKRPSGRKLLDFWRSDLSRKYSTLSGSPTQS